MPGWRPPRTTLTGAPSALSLASPPLWDHARTDEQVIPILRVANAADAVAWYERLGFTEEWEHRIEPGWPVFVSIARGRARLFLSEHPGAARPDTLVQLFVSDIAPVVAEFEAASGTVNVPVACPIGRSTPGNYDHSRTARNAGSPAYRQANPPRKPAF
jgi:hypothetical protein